MSDVIVSGHMRIPLGRVGENDATRVIWPDLLDEWVREYGTGSVQMLARRTGDAVPYPVPVDTEDGRIIWRVSAADVARPGLGACELDYLIGERVVKTQRWGTLTEASMSTGTEDAPEAPWVDQVLQAAAEVESVVAAQTIASGEISVSGEFTLEFDFVPDVVFLGTWKQTETSLESPSIFAALRPMEAAMLIAQGRYLYSATPNNQYGGQTWGQALSVGWPRPVTWGAQSLTVRPMDSINYGGIAILAEEADPHPVCYLAIGHLATKGATE